LNLKEILINFQINFAAFDLDGTLLNENGEVFDNIMKGLTLLKNQNIEMFIVTGRTVSSLIDSNIPKEFLELFNENIICNDGIILYNNKTKLIKTYSSIQSTIITKLIEYIGNKNDYALEIDGKIFSPNKRSALKYSMVYKINRGSIIISDPKSSLQEENITKFVIFPKQDEIKKILGFLKKNECNVKKIKFLDALEVTPKETCKATGLLNYLRENRKMRNLNKVISFGDGTNDCTLLKKCIFGISVIGSHPDAVKNSDMHLTQSLGEYLVQSLH